MSAKGLNPKSKITLTKGVLKLDKTKLTTILLISIMVSSISLIAINPASAAGPVTHFTLTFLKTTHTQAIANNVIITAMDASETKVDAYSGAVTLTCSDSNAILPPNTTIDFANGIASRTMYFGTPGSQTVTVTDVADPTLTGSLTVTVAPIFFSIAVYPHTITAGESVNVTVTALDGSANTLTDLGTSGYGHSVDFTSTDTQAVYPLEGMPRNLVSGIGVFNITLNTAGAQTITVINKGFPLVNATTTTITVNAPAQATATPTATPTQTAAPTVAPTTQPTQAPTATPTPPATNTSNNNFVIIAIIIIVVIVAVIAAVLFLRKKRNTSSDLPPPPPPPP